MESIIKAVLDADWTELTDYTEKRSSEKIQEKVQAKKAEFITKLNSDYETATEE